MPFFVSVMVRIMFWLAHFVSPGCPDGDEGYAPPGFCEHCRREAARRVLLDRILLHPVSPNWATYLQKVLYGCTKIVMLCAYIVQCAFLYLVQRVEAWKKVCNYIKHTCDTVGCTLPQPSLSIVFQMAALWVAFCVCSDD